MKPGTEMCYRGFSFIITGSTPRPSCKHLYNLIASTTVILSKMKSFKFTKPTCINIINFHLIMGKVAGLLPAPL
jgi:hypothetical protein